jgi:hypothetical protein
MCFNVKWLRGDMSSVCLKLAPISSLTSQISFAFEFYIYWHLERGAKSRKVDESSEGLVTTCVYVYACVSVRERERGRERERDCVCVRVRVYYNCITNVMLRTVSFRKFGKWILIINSPNYEFWKFDFGVLSLIVKNKHRPISRREDGNLASGWSPVQSKIVKTELWLVSGSQLELWTYQTNILFILQCTLHTIWQ